MTWVPFLSLLRHREVSARARTRSVGSSSWPLAMILTLISCHPSTVKPTVPPATVSSSTSANVEPLLAQPAALAAARGAGRLELLARGAHIPGDSPGGFALLGASECALVLARGSATVLDLDLYAFADDGTELGRDEAPDGDPAFVVCVKRPTRIFAAARVAQGSGLVSLGLQRLDPNHTESVLEALRPDGAERRAPTVWSGLEPLLAEHWTDIGGHWQALRRVAVPVDSRLPSSLSATIQADRCLDVLVVAGEDVRQLDVELLDEEGRIFRRAVALGNTRSAVACSGDLETTISIKLRPHSGRGNAVVLLSQTTSPAARRELHPEAFAIDIIPPGHTSPAPTSAAGVGSRLAGGATRQRLDLSVGRLTFAPAPVTGCSRLDFTPLAPLIGQRTSVYDPSGGLVGTSSSLAPATLFVCAKSSARDSPQRDSATATPRTRHLNPDPSVGHPAREELRLTAEATRRAGQLEVKVTPFPNSPSGLSQLPLAASRLLGLANDIGLLSEPAEIGRVVEVALQTDQLTRLQYSSPALHCLTFMVAVDRGARGLSVTAIDSSTGLVLDHQAGALAGSIRVCADTGGTRDFVVELQASQAPTRALIATRQAPLSRPAAQVRPQGADQ